jgi:hypothetical protein
VVTGQEDIVEESSGDFSPLKEVSVPTTSEDEDEQEDEGSDEESEEESESSEMSQESWQQVNLT